MRMRFKASMPDPRILIIQIVVVAVLASVFRNLLALFLLVLIVDFLLLLQCGWAVFWKNLLSYAAMLLILFALQEIYIPIISDLFPLFLLLMARLYPAYLAVRVLIEKAPMDELLFSLEIWRVPKLVLIPLAVIYRYIPTILKEIGYIRKISEELSAASICKGLSTKRKRTCCTKVKLRVTDSIYLLCVALLAAGLAFINYHVILL